MNKLTKNIIIGASATTAVAGAGAGAAVAFTHKDKDAKANNQAAQTETTVKPNVALPGQEELKAAQSAQEHNMLNPNHVPEDKTTHISATDVKTEVPHAMEFFVPATLGDKVVDGSADTESQAIRKDKEEKALAAAFKHAIETEDKSEHTIIMDQTIDIPMVDGLMPILEREMVEIPAETFKVEAPQAKMIAVPDREIVTAQPITFEVKAPEAKFIPINEFHELQTARQELAQEAIDFENEKIERDMAVQEQLHQEKLKQQAAEQLAQENQEKLEEFVNQLNHEIHELKNEADNNADIAAELSSQVNKQGNVQMTSNSLDEESKAAQAAFDASKDTNNKKTTYVGETSGQSDYEASQLAHEQRVAAEAGALAAKEVVASFDKLGARTMTGQAIEGAEQADQMMLGAKVFAAQQAAEQAAEQKRELSRDEVARLEIELADKGRDLAAGYEKQAAETAKNYALAESEIEARLQQRHHEEVSRQVHANLDDKKASSIAQEMYETQKHGAEVDAIRVAQEVFNRQRAEVEAELRGEARQHALQQSKDLKANIEGKKAQGAFDNAKTETPAPTFGEANGQKDYEDSQGGHANRIAGVNAAEEFAAEMKAAQDHAKEVEQAGKDSNTVVNNQISEQTKTLETEYKQQQIVVGQVLEQRHEAAVEAARVESLIKDLNAAQIKLVADAQRTATQLVTSSQMNEFGNWREINRQEANQLLPLDIVNKLFASPITKQVNVQITQNDNSAVLYAIVENGGEHADGSIGYAEFALRKQIPLGHYDTSKANQVVYDANNALPIQIRANLFRDGMKIDLFNPANGITVDHSLTDQLRANGVHSAQVVVLRRGMDVSAGQGTYGAGIQLFLNGQKTITDVYFAIKVTH